LDRQQSSCTQQQRRGAAFVGLDGCVTCSDRACAPETVSVPHYCFDAFFAGGGDLPSHSSPAFAAALDDAEYDWSDPVYQRRGRPVSPSSTSAAARSVSPSSAPYSIFAGATTHTKVDVRKLDDAQRAALRAAQAKELQSFVDHDVYDAVPLRSVSHLAQRLRTLWVNSLKLTGLDPDGKPLHKFKGRLVVRGDMDTRDGLDVSTAVPPMEALRVVLARRHARALRHR
jgi:hypothetical protein